MDPNEENLKIKIYNKKENSVSDESNSKGSKNRKHKHGHKHRD